MNHTVVEIARNFRYIDQIVTKKISLRCPSDICLSNNGAILVPHENSLRCVTCAFRIDFSKNGRQQENIFCFSKMLALFLEIGNQYEIGKGVSRELLELQLKSCGEGIREINSKNYITVCEKCFLLPNSCLLSTCKARLLNPLPPVTVVVKRSSVYWSELLLALSKYYK